MRNLLMKDVMTAAPATIRSDLPVWQAWKKMRSMNARHLPVLEGGIIVGIVSDRDLHLVSSCVSNDLLKVSEAMTGSPYCVEPTEPVTNVIRKMLADKIGCAIVVDHRVKDLVVGIFTQLDGLKILMNKLDAESNYSNQASV